MQRDYWPTTKWLTQDPAALGMDTKKLLELDLMINAQYSNLNGIVIVHKGYIAFEKYYNNKGPDDMHHVASVTKSITSALIGIAIDSGSIKSVDEKVLDFFPEYISNAADVQKRGTAIRHLLTMTAPYPFQNWHEPLDRMVRQPDWTKFTLDMLGQKGSLGTFKYSTSGAHLLSAILTCATGKCARAFANEHLFKPIGMKVIPDYEMDSFGLEEVFGSKLKGWVHDPNGHSTGGWGLTLTLRDMARFGFLYLNDGIWDDKQIIAKTWIDASTAPQSKTLINNATAKYGYLWWLYEEDGIFAYSAMGDGGNVICCIPEKDLIVAIASEIVRNPHDRWPLIKKCCMLL